MLLLVDQDSKAGHYCSDSTKSREARCGPVEIGSEDDAGDTSAIIVVVVVLIIVSKT